MKSGMIRRIIFAAGLLTLGLFSGGCQAVKPYERATLSTYMMRPDRDPLDESLREHIYFTREAGAGGRGVGGGGCGCN